MAVLGSTMGISTSSFEDDAGASYEKGTIEKKITESGSENYIELYDIDLTPIGGGIVLHLTNNSYTDQAIYWQGNEYTPIAMKVEGFEYNSTTSAPAQPTITISNVGGIITAYVAAYRGLRNAVFTRWRTWKEFLDGEAEENPSAHFPPDRFLFSQKLYESEDAIQWQLKTPLERPNTRLPLRQVLKDQTINNLHAPGVSRIRVR